MEDIAVDIVCLLYCQVISGEMLHVHLILDDPTGNSYMQVFSIALSSLSDSV